MHCFFVILSAHFGLGALSRYIAHSRTNSTNNLYIFIRASFFLSKSFFFLNDYFLSLSFAYCSNEIAIALIQWFNLRFIVEYTVWSSTQQQTNRFCRNNNRKFITSIRKICVDAIGIDSVECINWWLCRENPPIVCSDGISSESFIPHTQKKHKFVVETVCNWEKTTTTIEFFLQHQTKLNQRKIKRKTKLNQATAASPKSPL